MSRQDEIKRDMFEHTLVGEAAEVNAAGAGAWW